MKLSIFNYLEQLGKRLILKWAEKSDIKCPKCKGIMEQEGQNMLYLIPAYTDDCHEDTVDYYINGAVRIEDESQIPAGRRSCYIAVTRCNRCFARRVSVVDFLKVRDYEIIKGGAEFAYEEMADFLEK